MLVVSNGAFKSGSTWLYRIARILVGPRRVPEEFQDPKLAHPSVDRKRVERFLTVANLDRVDYVSKNHIQDAGTRATLLSSEHVRVLNITRDLRDVLVSAYFHDRREGHAEGEVGDYWRGLGRRRIAGVIEHHRIWNTGHSQVFVASYEALHASFEAQVQALAAFLEVEGFDLEEVRAGTDFDRLQAKSASDDPFHRKGIVGDWRNHLTSEIVDELAQLADSSEGVRPEAASSADTREYGQAATHARRGSGRGRKRRGRPFDAVAVHQMGKVGSRSLYEAVDELGLWPCFHTLLLNPSDRALQPGVTHVPKGSKKAARHLASSQKLRARYLDRGRPVAVVTAIREPIGRNVSAFFQRLHAFLAEGDVEENDPHGLYKLFKANFPHSRPQTWLEEELNEPFGIDVFSHPFPTEGWMTLDAPPHRVLVLRTSMPDAAKSTALRDFLGVNALTIGQVHETHDARDAAVYERFKELVSQDRDYVESMLSMPMAEHFFSEPERREIRNAWLTASVA